MRSGLVRTSRIVIRAAYISCGRPSSGPRHFAPAAARAQCPTGLKLVAIQDVVEPLPPGPASHPKRSASPDRPAASTRCTSSVRTRLDNSRPPSPSRPRLGRLLMEWFTLQAQLPIRAQKRGAHAAPTVGIDRSPKSRVPGHSRPRLPDPTQRLHWAGSICNAACRLPSIARKADSRLIIPADAHHSGSCFGGLHGRLRPPHRPVQVGQRREAARCLGLSAGDTLRVLRESPQPGYVPHCDAAAPVGGVSDRQTLVARHHSQRFSGA